MNSSTSTHHAQLNERIEIGRYTYGQPVVYSWEEGTYLKIGAFCSIAKGVKILLGGEHRVDWVTTYPFSALWDKAQHISGHPASKGNVIIGNDVWLGMDCVILSGVSIGDGAVIGTSSVVAKDVPPYSIYAGNPAKFIRNRFDEATIDSLLDIKWWEWEDHKIEQMLPLLLNNDVQGFLTAARKGTC